MTNAPQLSAGEPVPFHRQLISIWAGARPARTATRHTGLLTEFARELADAGKGYRDTLLSYDDRQEFIREAIAFEDEIDDHLVHWKADEVEALLAETADLIDADNRDAPQPERPLADRIRAVYAGERPKRETYWAAARRSESFGNAVYEIALAGRRYLDPDVSEAELTAIDAGADRTAVTFGRVLADLTEDDIDAFLAEVGFIIDRDAGGPAAAPAPALAPAAPAGPRHPQFLTSRDTAAPLATLLINTWAAVEPKSNITLHPASYSESFLDLARAAADAGYGHQYPAVSEAAMSALYAKAQRIVNNLSRPDGTHNPADIVEFLTEAMDIMRVRPLAVPGEVPTAADVWDRMIRSSISIDADRVRAAAFAILDDDPELDLGIASQRARDQINPYGKAGLADGDDQAIRRARAEAHDEAVAMVCEMVGVPNVNWPNRHRDSVETKAVG